jgi:hypothetical protein
MGKQEKPYALSTDISTDNKGDMDLVGGAY